jgi:hypothetical protein
MRALVEGGERNGMTALLLELDEGGLPGESARLARRIRTHNPARPLLFLFAEIHYQQLAFASFGLGGDLRQLIIDRAHLRPTDLETLEELAAGEGEGSVELLLRHARALDRTRLGHRFFRDFRAQRDRIAAAWTGLPDACRAEREQLALLFLCRLLFLYFLQRPGYLAGDAMYLPNLLRRWQRRPGEGTFFRAVLGPLFFGALNTRPERRETAARALGALPYMNGGLFERHALERRCPGLDLPDDVATSTFDALLERYRFTTREMAETAADGAGEVGIDPEMLGRVFEELMAADRREASGTFFTPAPVVDRMVQGALEAWLRGSGGLEPAAAARLVRQGDAGALAEPERARAARALAHLRALDPACGSGAFLLGALSRIARVRAALGGAALPALRAEIVGHTLHGLDLQEDAALLCALRLWLALTVGAGTEPAPLPNLDRRIRQGDALLDPLDLATGGPGGLSPWDRAATDAAVRRALREVAPLATRYLSADPDEKPPLQRALRDAEVHLARSWLDAIARRLASRLAELRAEAEARDLFGERTPAGRTAEITCRALEGRAAEVAELARALDDGGALPFFSFDVHFAEAAERGFDLILSNPPWVRAHRWPAALGRLVRQRYAVCRSAGWRRGATLAGAPGGGAQVDLSLLFLERSLRLLAPRGVLAMLLPAKALRSLYGAGGRRLLLQETRLASLEDHSLDQRSIFRADAFAAAVVAERRPPEGSATPPEPGVRVTMLRRGVPPLRFAVPQGDLPLIPGDPDAPWLIAPPEVRAVIRRMQRSGRALGEDPALRPRRGVMTGANDVLLLSEVQPRLGDIAWIRAEGYARARQKGRDAAEARRYEAFVETEAVRPLVRGSDVGAWHYSAGGHTLWTHDDRTAAPTPPPPRTARYLARHDKALRARSGWRSTLPLGALFRATPGTVGPKVAWQDLAATLEAVALPAHVRGPAGRDVPLIPLNTVYFIPTASAERALLLAALFNSLPLRTFARAIAERAKDARFRFFAWTVALLPLPLGWEQGIAAPALLRLSREAHEQGGLDAENELRLNRIVASLYGLLADDLEALERFDRWLRGVP